MRAALALAWSHGGSSNGRTPDSDSGCLGSNPSPPATKIKHLGLSAYTLKKSWTHRGRKKSAPECLCESIPASTETLFRRHVRGVARPLSVFLAATNAA